MALDLDYIPDEAAVVTPATATATPGGAGPAVVPPVGRTPLRPVVTPAIPAAPLSPLEQVMIAHNESFLGRMRNIGAGGSVKTGITESYPGGALGDYKLRAIGTGITSVLSGGFLGSYSLSAKGSIEKALDAITEQRTGIDYNSTTRVSNIWKSADDQIFSLSAKIRLCDEMGKSIDDQIDMNGGLARSAIAVRAAPAAATKAAANEVATMWGKIKPFHSQIGVGAGSFAAIAMLGCPPLAAAALCGALPVGVAMAIRKAKNAPSYDETDTKKLSQARAVINTIRQNAELKRDEFLKKIEKEYPQEIKAQKDTQAYFAVEVPKIVSKEDAAKLLDDYESLIMRPPLEPDEAIKSLLNTMGAMKRADNAASNAFNRVDLGKLKTSLTKLLSKKGNNYRRLVNESLGLLEAIGPEQMTALIKRLCQIHKIIPQTGRILTLSTGAGGATKTFRINRVSLDNVDINLEEVTVTKNTLNDEIIVKTVPGNRVSIHLDKSTMKLQREMNKVLTDDLINEMKTRTDSDLKSGTLEDVTRYKKLLSEAQNRRLSVNDYKALWAALIVPPADYAKKGLPLISKIATGTSDTFEQIKVDKESTEDLMAEIRVKSESDLTSGTPGQKKLLADAQTKRLSVPEYKALWAALKPAPHYARNNLPLISKIANSPSNTFEQEDVDKEPVAALMAEIATKGENDLLPASTPAIEARHIQLLNDAKTRKLTVPEYRELFAALKPTPLGQLGLTKIKAIANGGPNPEYIRVPIEDTDALELDIKKIIP